ncbi:single-stranded-DNA-specific exonuclease RecJ [Desulfovirgula thermocuniculi]|uniref:single-stranded-DNA-specific exonuclease RecJ n=1 Tax=Desulfovirgula thermocuniculi TaxID=348842 RepID=UPI000686726F|nr:single-stranded-DNA-specific exonuclease RecJ [Desulfovirgula thermocuniculi]
MKGQDPVLQEIISREMGISPLLARLLVNRRVLTVEDARFFLRGTLEQAADPFLLPDMPVAVERIVAAVKRKEKILVYGDYDTDGVTATALMVSALRRLGAKVDYYIPHRLHQGYGLHTDVLNWARQAGYGLVVTVDCGVSARKEIEEAGKAGGPEVIVTDHHHVPEEMPPALAVVNPCREDSLYPFNDLAGAGVALKLAQALLEAAGEGREAWQDFLDLACLGTVADLVPLVGENRLIVKYGLPRLADTSRPGLRALMQLSGLKPERLGVREVGFALAPRLNAAGRMDDPRLAVELLLCRDEGQALELAAGLDHLNRKRQEVEAKVLAEALGMIEAGEAGEMVVVLASSGWHPGVTGIVASRLVEMLYRPVLLVSIEGERGKGSGRSIPGFHLYRALHHCRQHLLAYGGHEGAAGFTVHADRVEDLRAAINEYASCILTPELLVPSLDIDALVSLDELVPETVAELECLAPFGPGNPEPVLACRGACVVSVREAGRDGRHLKLWVRERETALDAIGFALGSYLEEIKPGESLDLAFVPVLDRWNGTLRVQLELKDLRSSGKPGCTCLEEGPPLLVNGFLDELFKQAAEALQKSTSWFVPECLQRQAAGGFFSPALPFVAEGEIAASRGAAQVTPRAPSVVALRGTAARSSWLARLAARGERLLVITGSAHRAVELAAFFRQVSPEAGVAFGHMGLPWEQLEAICRMFALGEISTLVVTPSAACLAAAPRLDGVVLYDPPCHREEWEMVLRAARSGGARQLFLCFDLKDLREIRDHIESLVPDRDFLARLYIALRWLSRREAVPRGLRREPFWHHLAGLLRREGYARAQEFTVAAGLTVFEELGLVRKVAEGRFLLPRIKGEKRDLSSSPTFCRLQRLKEEVSAWVEYVLGRGVENLI